MKMPSNPNRPWNLESFLDSLIVELDKARETLAVKAVNKPLTYSVKDLALELQIFPEFDGQEVRFLTARPGETGASKVSIQLASITDKQIRETTKKPATKEDVVIEAVEELDEQTKRSLKKIGVSSVEDLQQIEEKNINLEKVTGAQVNYSKLAKLIDKARRQKAAPKVFSISYALDGEEPVLQLSGENLSISAAYQPEALINQQQVKIIGASPAQLTISLGAEVKLHKENELLVALDPYTLIKLNIKN